MCYKTRKYTVCRRICASFSPEILQAGAVKGLLPRSYFKTLGQEIIFTWHSETQASFETDPKNSPVSKLLPSSLWRIWFSVKKKKKITLCVCV